MTLFLSSIAVLIVGYVVYGLIAERVFKIDPSRTTPAYERTDGIDYMPLPTWKVFLIQFLNIAGLGPIFGAIMGIMFGPAAFLWIVLGTIFAGGVHDFISAMMSVRSGGLSLPEVIGHELGTSVKQVMRAFSLLLLVLVGAVFVINPADILAEMTPDYLDSTVWIGIIFTYYLLATLLPIDKLIGNLYPVFGFALLFMAVGLLVVLFTGSVTIPDGIADGLYSRHKDGIPIFPMMFVSIACGAISGFHATQSPMMARCLKNEKLARPIFYGAMVAEGLVALIWAAAAIAFTNGYDGLNEYMTDSKPAHLVTDISVTWLGTFGGLLAIIGVVAAPITTGDTALRSARLIAADFMKFDQRKFWKRVVLSFPIFALAFVVMLIDFKVLWRYFAWCNQTLAVFTLWGATVYLARHHRAYIITMLPAMFMTAVSISYLMCAPRPEGFGIDVSIAIATGSALSIVLTAIVLMYIRRINTGRINRKFDY
ncbi:MAG: carbon starvation protein A [Bacteroides sp.]|nr:carbon starvation protein A [Bacteroides sp.]